MGEFLKKLKESAEQKKAAQDYWANFQADARQRYAQDAAARRSAERVEENRRNALNAQSREHYDSSRMPRIVAVLIDNAPRAIEESKFSRDGVTHVELDWQVGRLGSFKLMAGIRIDTNYEGVMLVSGLATTALRIEQRREDPDAEEKAIEKAYKLPKLSLHFYHPPTSSSGYDSSERPGPGSY